MIQFLSIVAVAICAVIFVLRLRSSRVSDVWMLPIGGGHAVLISSQWPGYCEVTAVRGWPGPKAGWWSGRQWKNVGPFLVWTSKHELARAGIWWRTGIVRVPRQRPGGPIEYQRSYDRAVALGFPTRMGTAADCAAMSASQVKFPHVYLLIAAALLPLGYFSRVGFDAWRARQRRDGLHCQNCGYDLRATPERCPECGMAAAIRM